MTIPPRLMLGLILLAAAVALAGCQRGPVLPAERVPKMRWLVMPLEQPEAMEVTPRDIRGWWFGARTIRQNPRSGALVAETISRELARLDYVSQFSQLDLRNYFADKRELLESAWPDLDRDRIDALLADVPPIEFARQLRADKLLTGRITRHHMGENRTIHWWWSVLDARVEVIDVRSGRTEWSRDYRIRGQLASTPTIQERLAERLIEDLKREYFLPLTRN